MLSSSFPLPLDFFNAATVSRIHGLLLYLPSYCILHTVEKKKSRVSFVRGFVELGLSGRHHNFAGYRQPKQWHHFVEVIVALVHFHCRGDCTSCLDSTSAYFAAKSLDMESKLYSIVGLVLVLCNSAFSFSPRLSIMKSTRRWVGVDERSWGNELGDNGVGSWGGHSSINEALSDVPTNSPARRSNSGNSGNSNNQPSLSPRVRASLERTVLRTVVSVLEGRASGSEEYHSLFQASGAGKVQEDGMDEDYTREESTGPMSARMLGTMLKGVPIRKYECSTLVGLKRLYNYVGGVARFCRDHADVITIDEVCRTHVHLCSCIHVRVRLYLFLRSRHLLLLLLLVLA